MSFTNTGQITYGEPVNYSTSAPLLTTNILDAVGEYVAVIFRAPVTTTITHIETYIGTISGTSGSSTLDCRVETVSDTTGLPTGTLWGTNTNGSLSVAFNDDNKFWNVALTSAASITRGDVVALVIKADTLATAAAINLNLDSRSTQIFPSYSVSALPTATKVTSSNMIGIWPRFTGSTYSPVIGLMPFSTVTTNTMNTGAAVRRQALKFRVPVAMTLVGCKARVLTSAGGNFDVKVYESNGTTQVGTTLSIDLDQIGATANIIQNFIFPADVSISANTDYYISFEPTTANNLTMYYYTAESNARLDLMPGCKELFVATHNGTSWTDRDTGYALIYPIFNQISSGSNIIVSSPQITLHDSVYAVGV